MTVKKVIAAVVIALATPVLAQPPAPAADSGWPADWYRPAEPVTILPNVHYVGSEGISAFLVTGPAGHVLIDGGLPENAPMIAANIRKLGFRLEDVRFLLINHAHFDHAGGLAQLKKLTGATLVASRRDAPDLNAGQALIRPEQPPVPPVKVDRIVGEGDVVTLGPIRLVAHMTPGHTPGATSWAMTTAGPDGRPLNVLFATSLTVAGLKLPAHPGYKSAAADFRRSFSTLRKMKADVYLTFHPGRFGFAEKVAKLKAGDKMAFVDPGELTRRVADAEREFAEESARQARAAQ
jgi:metallo-beta-lactamase class B